MKEPIYSKLVGRPKAAFLNHYMQTGTLSRPYAEMNSAFHDSMRNLGSIARGIGVMLNEKERENEKKVSQNIAMYQAKVSALREEMVNPDGSINTDLAYNFMHNCDLAWDGIWDENGGVITDRAKEARSIFDTRSFADVDAKRRMQEHRDRQAALVNETNAFSNEYGVCGDIQLLLEMGKRNYQIAVNENPNIDFRKLENVVLDEKKGNVTMYGTEYKIIDDDKLLDERKKHPMQHFVRRSDVQKISSAMTSLVKRGNAEADKALTVYVNNCLKTKDYDAILGAFSTIEGEDSRIAESGTLEDKLLWKVSRPSQATMDRVKSVVNEHKRIQFAAEEANNSVNSVFESLVDKDATGAGKYMTAEYDEALQKVFDSAQKGANDNPNDEAKRVYSQTVRNHITQIRNSCKVNEDIAYRKGLDEFYPIEKNENGVEEIKVMSAADRASFLSELPENSPVKRRLFAKHQEMLVNERKEEILAEKAKNKENLQRQKELRDLDFIKANGIVVAAMIKGNASDDTRLRRLLAAGNIPGDIINTVLTIKNNSRTQTNVEAAGRLVKAFGQRYKIQDTPDGKHTVVDFLAERMPDLLSHVKDLGVGLNMGNARRDEKVHGDAAEGLYKQNIFHFLNRLEEDLGDDFIDFIQDEWEEYCDGKDDEFNFKEWVESADRRFVSINGRWQILSKSIKELYGYTEPEIYKMGNAIKKNASKKDSVKSENNDTVSEGVKRKGVPGISTR